MSLRGLPLITILVSQEDCVPKENVQLGQMVIESKTSLSIGFRVARSPEHHISR